MYSPLSKYKVPFDLICHIITIYLFNNADDTYYNNNKYDNYTDDCIKMSKG